MIKRNLLLSYYKYERKYQNIDYTFDDVGNVLGYDNNCMNGARYSTKQTSKLDISYGQSDEYHHRYYYHPDHLGSAQLVTDYEGNEYQRIEYTPYGELWVEKKSKTEEGLRFLPYKFTAKEQDEETGLYYYGARYLDAKYSRWLSTDPAVKDYMSGTSAGEGGIYNTVNFSLYHYAGNNPIRYVDPNGREDEITPTLFDQYQWESEFGKKFADNACAATSLVNLFSDIYTKETGEKMSYEQGIASLNNAIANNGLDPKNAWITDWQKAENAIADSLNLKGIPVHNEFSPEYMIYALDTDNNPKTAEHFVSVNQDKATYFDAWDSKHKNIVSDINTKTIDAPQVLINFQQDRPFRGFNYIIK